jgi:hypothetical protein
MTLSLSKTVRRTSVAALLLFCALVRAEAQTADADRLWTTVGSAGTADEADVRKIVFDHAFAQFGQPLINAIAAAAPGTVLAPSDSASFDTTSRLWTVSSRRTPSPCACAISPRGPEHVWLRS